MIISVIVVTYNQEKTIARTLESILSQQTDVDFEIVIGDDASHDQTEAICRDFASRYPDKIIYLRRPKNIGVTANYFDCIAHARGKYLADCAGDDYWSDTSKLASQLEILEKNPEVSLVATDWLCRDELSGQLSRHPRNPEIKSIERIPARSILPLILTGERIIHLCSALYRKDILDQALNSTPEAFLNPEFSCEDQQILLLMAQKGDIMLLPGISLHYSIGHPSVSNRQGYDNRFEYSLRAFRQALSLARHFGIDIANLKNWSNERINHLAAMALRAGPQPSCKKNQRRVQRLLKLINDNRFSAPAKARLYITVMAMPPLWKLINTIRK